MRAWARDKHLRGRSLVRLDAVRYSGKRGDLPVRASGGRPLVHHARHSVHANPLFLRFSRDVYGPENEGPVTRLMRYLMHMEAIWRCYCTRKQLLFEPTHPIFCLLSDPHDDAYGIAFLTRNPFCWPWHPHPPPVAFIIDLVFPKSNSTIHSKQHSQTFLSPTLTLATSTLDGSKSSQQNGTSLHRRVIPTFKSTPHVDPPKQSINAYGAFILTTNVSISGTFNAFSGLVLRTSNAPIDAIINVYRPDTSPTSYVSPTHPSTPPSLYTNAGEELNRDRYFSLSARTTNGALTLSVPEIPVNSHGHIAASTSNNPAHVSLHPAYEGPFKVRTLDAPARLEIDDNVEDPVGLGRERCIIQHQRHLGNRNADDDDDNEHDLPCGGGGGEGSHFSAVAASMDQLPLGVTHHNAECNRTLLLSQKPSGNVLSGNVFWSEADKCRGGIDLKTSHPPAVLSL